MKLKLYLSIFLLGGSRLLAQLPEDALRMSWATPSGTARHQAIGGAMGSLGGEITTLFVNPAGLASYKTSEFVISPGFNILGGKSTFRESQSKAENIGRFNFGTTGFVWGFNEPHSRWKNKAFSIAVNRTATFNSSVFYRGQNDYSSFAEPLANEFAGSHLTIDQALNDPSVSLLTKMALYTYLVDTATVNGSTEVIARSEQAGTVNQQNKVTTYGGVTEISLGFAGNMDDRLYVGASLGVPIVHYERNTEFREEDANGAGNNEFLFSDYSEKYTSTGAGINAKLGLIFKPAEFIRIGFAIHTPTFYGLKESISSTLTTNIDTATGSVKEFSVNSDAFDNGSANTVKYDLRSPLKLILSASYVIREVEDVTRQRGFITADVEYTSHASSRFTPSESGVGGDYFDAVNEAIKSIYKKTFNFRVGGELKFNTIMGRLGFAYYGNPYKDAALKANRMSLSGGLGYRNKGVFIDLTYVHNIIKDVNFPYRVDAPRLNTFAELKNRVGLVMLTVGLKM